jgi:hypothetical protein
MRDVDTVNFLPGQPARAARAGRPKIPPKRPFGTFINKGKSRLLKANKGKKNKKLMKVNEAAKNQKWLLIEASGQMRWDRSAV